MRIFNLVKNYIFRTFSINESNRINNYKPYFQNLKGKNGLEIGGPSSIFEENGIIPIYSIVKSLNGCNFSENTVWQGKIKEGRYYKYGGRTGYQFISDAINLRTMEPDSYDFIIASHVLEHIANPFRALSEWLRVLKDEGVLLLILPHKDGTFDHKRPVTTIKHLIEDFENDINEDDLSHLPEILKLHDLNLDPAAGDLNSFKERSLHNYENRCLHQHVFDTKLVVEILNYFKIRIISMEVHLPYHIIFLGKKTNNFQERDNDKFLDGNTDLIFKNHLKSDISEFK